MTHIITTMVQNVYLEKDWEKNVQQIPNACLRVLACNVLRHLQAQQSMSVDVQPLNTLIIQPRNVKTSNIIQIFAEIVMNAIPRALIRCSVEYKQVLVSAGVFVLMDILDSEIIATLNVFTMLVVQIRIIVTKTLTIRVYQALIDANAVVIFIIVQVMTHVITKSIKVRVV